MEQGQGMKRNFKVTTILFGAAAVLMGFAAITVSQQPMRKMFAILGSVFMISAVLQMILYRRQKTLFKDRHN
jgi:uncharacterized membrane protein YfcA